MSSNDWLVIVGGLAVGFLVVWMFYGSSQTNTPAPSVQALTSGWHVTLGVAPDATFEEIQGAYLRLKAEYDPAKVETLGPELRALASRKSDDVAAAYQAARQARGIA